MKGFGITQAIGALVSKLEQAKKVVASKVNRVLGRSVVEAEQRGGGLIIIDPHHVGEVYSLLTVTRDAMKSGNIEGELLRALAWEIVTELRAAVAPISRTGRLASSFAVEEASPSEFIVYSTAPYAGAILEGIGTVPPIARLMDWMLSKGGEFADLSYKERRRTAFAIQRSMASGTGAGKTGRSTLRTLTPEGELAFDYVSVAMEQMEPELERLGVEVRRVFT